MTDTPTTDADLDPAHDLPADPRDPMSDVQAAELRRLADATGTEMSLELTQREAARRIAHLRELAG
ncbi:hypothetical protein ROJ8625_02372 [Roseivivax jejudonensis]|uniref:DUF3072 domain-containing protein n=1 Tax=Roseivivax jejudonensis TaxID=1529041 RepID=A0A1X6ZDI5_9RHOB|nr:DUF3072 domain-containing protein [Roseivivax jejudonensis]SLN48638.1 hypothetical protein ROJ8625_02372 [Roseivivax jejudonensis]